MLDAHNFFAAMAKDVTDFNPRAEFHLITGYTRDGDKFNFQFSSPPANLLGSLGLIVRPSQANEGAEPDAAEQPATAGESNAPLNSDP